MALPGEEFDKPRFSPGFGCGLASLGNNRRDVGFSTGGGRLVEFVGTCGVGAEGKSATGRSGLDAGGASIGCVSGRGGATLLNVFGLMRTFGPGAAAGAFDTEGTSDGRYTMPKSLPALMASSGVGMWGGKIFGRKIKKMMKAM